MSDNINQINRTAWNKIALEGRTVHPSKGAKEEEMLRLFMKKLPHSAKVLDLGCGNGVPIGKKLYNAGFNIVGVDISDEMVKEYQKNLPNSEVFRMSMTDINWIEVFDGAISSFSMLQVPPQEFADTARKVIQALKPKGIFLLILNEGNSAQGEVQVVQGQRMYSTGVSEEEVRNNFKDEMKLLKIERETIITKEYGRENTIMFLFQKTRTASGS